MTKEKYLTLKEIFADIGKFKGANAHHNCAMCFFTSNGWNQVEQIPLKISHNWRTDKKAREQFNCVMRVGSILGKSILISWS